MFIYIYFKFSCLILRINKYHLYFYLLNVILEIIGFILFKNINIINILIIKNLNYVIQSFLMIYILIIVN